MSPKWVELALLAPDRLEAPKLFGSLQELRMAMATLDTAVLRVMPWNWEFKTLHLFLLSNNFCAFDLGGKLARLIILTGFVNKVSQNERWSLG